MSGGVDNRPRLPAGALQARRVLLPVSAGADDEGAASGTVNGNHLEIVDPASDPPVVDELDQPADGKAGVTRVLD
jgi:hypothetical protein